jgi:outer membrane lipoprotein LolB
MRRNAVLVIAVSMLTACATQSRTATTAQAELAYQQRHDYLVSLVDWSLTGRLAASNGDEGGSGTLTWRHNASVTQMSFRGAMGKGAWELQASPGQAQLRFADGREFSATTIAQLVTAHMQAKVPVDALSWWVFGLARPNEWE